MKTCNNMTTVNFLLIYSIDKGTLGSCLGPPRGGPRRCGALRVPAPDQPENGSLFDFDFQSWIPLHFLKCDEFYVEHSFFLRGVIDI